ncbi:MAG: MBOAT family protein [Flavobacteriaceae bacterium]|nr:MBOAT family protein [Flavobacteriaceae bacterium]
MLFNSLHFVVFFLMVTPLYWLMPHRGRWAMLLAASCYFYMVFRPEYILILSLTIGVDYYAGLRIHKAEGKQRKIWLGFSLVSTCLILCVFKYFDFIGQNINVLFGAVGWEKSFPLLEIMLPIGLSFHTFQSLSYVIEVYRGKQQPEKHFGIYSLYVMFYPQLVAGPIERPQNLLHQFRERKQLSPAFISEGLMLILWGFFKKLCIADRLGEYVEVVFNDPAAASGTETLLAIWFFAIQIYCDFSGYSDIAIGTAKCMGFSLSPNFNRPYAALSLRDFWNRWHISLSSWFRDYVYIPLGGNKSGIRRHIINLMLTFILSGLWHGARWNFVAWGALHGVFMVLSIAGTGKREAERRPFPLRGLGAWFFTFNLVCLLWVFFAAKSIGQAVEVLKGLGHTYSISFPFGSRFEIVTDLLIALPLLFILFFSEWKLGSNPLYSFTQNKSLSKQWGWAWALGFLILCFGAFTKTQTFIYFQF